MNKWQRLLAAGLVAAGILAPSAAAVAAPKAPGGAPVPAVTASGIHICYAVWFHGSGWSQLACDGAVAANPASPSQQIDAVKILTEGVGGICAFVVMANNAHSPGQQCELRDDKYLWVGTPEQGQGISGLGISVQGSNHVVCANGYLSADGWEGYACAYSPLTAETGGWAGQMMEALRLTVS